MHFPDPVPRWLLWVCYFGLWFYIGGTLRGTSAKQFGLRLVLFFALACLGTTVFKYAP